MIRDVRGVLTGAAGVVVGAVLAPLALATHGTAPKLIGNSGAGTAIFTATCQTCHGGSGIGPDLHILKLTEAQIIRQVQYGGSKIMGEAAGNYAVTMSGYKGVLTSAQINNVSAFVYKMSHRSP